MADHSAGSFPSRVAVENDPAQPRVASPGSLARSSGLQWLQAVGLYFLAGSAYGLYRLLHYGIYGGYSVLGLLWVAAGFYTAVRILQLDERGRTFGLLLSFLGLAQSLFLLMVAASGRASIPPFGLILMAVNVPVIWVLMASKDLVRR